MRRHHLPRDPLGERNPFQVYLLLVALSTGVPFMFGFVTAGTIEASLPRAYTFLWGLMLALGALAALAGMFWPRDARTGLLLKRFGLTALGFASAVYALALGARFSWEATLLVGVTAGFSAACCRQAWRVHQTIRHLMDVGNERR